jgi:hypothetical protein
MSSKAAPGMEDAGLTGRCFASWAAGMNAHEKAIRRDGYMIEGASGQRRLNAAVTELR